MKTIVLLFLTTSTVLGADLSTFRDELGLNRILGDVFSDLDLSSLKDVENCYDRDVNGRSLDLFNASLDLESIAGFYYQAFPEKEPSRKSIESLIDSTKDILTRCLRSGPKTAKFGYTELSDMPTEDLSKLTGLVLPSNLSLSSSSQGFVGLSGRDARCRASDTQVPSSFDWRSRGMVTPIRNQRSCGSCWAFATTASLESALLIKGKTNDKSLDLSEQQLVDCAQGDGCQGGFSFRALDYVQRRGLTSEQSWRYRGGDNRCPNNLQPVARISSYCVRSAFNYGFSTERLSDKDIQQALVKFGPMYIVLNANPLNTRNYRSGVFSDPWCTPNPNHAVTLVGYTPDAWIIKNSWGSNWGEQGYFRLARGRNMCGINSEIAYPLL